MSTSSVPRPTLGPLGYIVPSAAEVLVGVAADWNTAFGGNLDAPTAANPSQGLSTWQGQVISSQAAAISDGYTQFLFMVSQFDPQFATGRAQDALGYIYFMTRDPAVPTTVTCTCTGLVGTVIPANAQAQDTSKNLYLCTSGGIIGLAGTIDLVFQALVPGPTPCPANTLNAIYITVPGWSTINNASDGTPGRLVESQQAFEAKRQASVAVNGQNSLQAIQGAVFASFPPGNPANVPVDVYATENVTNAPVTVKGISLAAHSLYVAAAGGDSAAIAKAIWVKKSLGCNYNGTTTVVVEDTSYNPPYPLYNVKYTIPAALAIKFAVSITNVATLPSNITQLIKNAIQAAWLGTDGGPRMRIASDVVASRFYAPVAAISPLVIIQSILVGTTTATLASVVVNLDKIPAIQDSDITVTLV